MSPKLWKFSVSSDVTTFSILVYLVMMERKMQMNLWWCSWSADFTIRSCNCWTAAADQLRQEDRLINRTFTELRRTCQLCVDRNEGHVETATPWDTNCMNATKVTKNILLICVNTVYHNLGDSTRTVFFQTFTKDRYTDHLKTCHGKKFQYLLPYHWKEDIHGFLWLSLLFLYM